MSSRCRRGVCFFETTFHAYSLWPYRYGCVLVAFLTNHVLLDGIVDFYLFFTLIKNYEYICFYLAKMCFYNHTSHQISLLMALIAELGGIGNQAVSIL